MTDIQAIDSAEHTQRQVVRSAALQRIEQQFTRSRNVTAAEGFETLMNQLFGRALLLGLRASRPIDIGARTVVRAIQEQDPRPEIDGGFEFTGEVVVEAGDEKMFDSRVVFCAFGPLGGATARRKRIHHVKTAAIITPGAVASAFCFRLKAAPGAGQFAIRYWLFAKCESRIANRRRCGRSSTMPVIECVPNVSEGRRPEVIAAIADALRAVPGLRVLDVQADATHNRSVFTLAGGADALAAGIPILFERAIAAIDLRTHDGAHPRLGAVDVVPFVPIAGVTMADCVALAKQVGAEVARRFDVPIYLYEDAASEPHRKGLEDIRRGEFEGLEAKMRDPAWTPDFGPANPHPSAGASVIGARMPLIAYNINLATDRLDVAKKIASAIRMSSGGFRFVKAMGLALEDRGIVQVSMNLTNYEKTPIFRVFETVKREAARYGVIVLESEIVGLVPASALTQAAEFYLQLDGFSAAQVLENKLAQDS